METLKQFSEKEKNYHLYQARVNAIREENARQLEWENAKKALQEERAARQAAEKERKKGTANSRRGTEKSGSHRNQTSPKTH